MEQLGQPGRLAAGEGLAAELGERARFVRTDVTDAASIEAAIELARQAFGGLQGVVHCAGIIAGGRILGKEGPHVSWRCSRVVQVNLIGTFNCLRLAACAAMAQNKPDEEGERGVIINTTSIAAFEGQIGQAAYSASKGKRRRRADVARPAANWLDTASA